MSSGEETMPSPYRNPAASSKSAPGVRIVTATVRLASSEIRRISIGSSVARASGRTRVRPSSTTRTRTFVLLPRRAFFALAFSSIHAPPVACWPQEVYQHIMLEYVSHGSREQTDMLRLMGLPKVARYPEATVTREDEH